MSPQNSPATAPRPASPRLTPVQKDQAIALSKLGMPMREIAENVSASYDQIELLLRDHRRAFLSGRSESEFEIRDDRIVQWRKRSRPDGGFDLRPSSLPRISMHIAALQENGRG